jgi:hypothetical protein
MNVYIDGSPSSKLVVDELTVRSQRQDMTSCPTIVSSSSLLVLSQTCRFRLRMGFRGVWARRTSPATSLGRTLKPPSTRSKGSTWPRTSPPASVTTSCAALSTSWPTHLIPTRRSSTSKSSALTGPLDLICVPEWRFTTVGLLTTLTSVCAAWWSAPTSLKTVAGRGSTPPPSLGRSRSKETSRGTMQHSTPPSRSTTTSSRCPKLSIATPTTQLILHLFSSLQVLLKIMF